jgi:diadenosine tetraphosphate (Ap4A) HIT family hydrolase
LNDTIHSTNAGGDLNPIDPLIAKILSEPCLCENSDYVVVADREPIVPGHYLLLSKGSLRSLALADQEALLSFLYNEFDSLVSCDYSLFEHGHGSFCSTFGHVVHAHAHLIPSSSIGDVSFSYGLPTAHLSLSLALNSVPSQSEYLLWGALRGKASLIVNSELPKRAVRNEIERAKL